MRLTPLDIKKQEFTRSFRGVDAQEVHDFLHELANQWDNLLEENRRLEQKISEYDSKLEHYRKIEEALQEALETARDNSHKTIENAQREAQIILKEARSAAEEMRKKSSQDHKRLKHDISKISGRRDEIVARLRAFLMSEMELLARFEGQDPIGFVRLDTNDHRRLTGRSHFEEDREVSAPYNQASQDDPFEEVPVDLPVEEEEISYEEEKTTAVHEPPQGAARDQEPFNFSLVNDDAEDSSSDGLSSDELEFIKSTVSSATHQVVDDDIFKPAESEINRTWNQTLGAQNGQSAPAAAEAEEPPQNDDSAGGWIVRPAVNNSQQDSPSTSANRGFSSSLFGPDQDNDDLSATPEEIEKIRRILNDLD